MEAKYVLNSVILLKVSKVEVYDDRKIKLGICHALWSITNSIVIIKMQLANLGSIIPVLNKFISLATGLIIFLHTWVLPISQIKWIILKICTKILF